VQTDLPAVLVPLRDRASEAALFLDYDGTLAPIVDDPAGAWPVRGVPELLARLGERLALVAVVSGRPVRFLVDMLGRPPGVHLTGLHGLEVMTLDGVVQAAPGAEEWRPVVAEVAREAARGAPAGAEVEPKGLSVTLHWRRAPHAGGWATEIARSVAARTGLVAHPGRMSIELRPPVHADKGTVVARLAAGWPVVGCFGDDLGDLPAFDALAELAADGVTVARVAVAGSGSPVEVSARADLVVQGPEEAVRMLRAVAGG
jgi:trehalose 6-phosphate phosphatase